MRRTQDSPIPPPARLDINYSREVVTPHVKWADPYANGPIRPFIVSGVRDGRVAVELMQRLTLEPRVVSIDPSFDVNRWWGERYRYDPIMNSEPADYHAVYEVLEEELARPVSYDALVMHSMIGWNDLPQKIKDLVYRRVAGGEGLVLVHPQLGMDETDRSLWDISPIVNVPATKLGGRARPIEPKEAISGAPWRKVADHYVVDGVPFEALPYPALRHYRYELGPDAQALVTGADGAPVVAVKHHGKGRVVGLGYYNHGLWPVLQARRGELNENFWEYLFSLLMRSLIWAARKEPQVTLRAVAPSAKRFPSEQATVGNVTLHVENSGEEMQASLAVTVRDLHRQTELEITKRARLSTGENTVTLDLPAVLAASGTHFVDVIVSAGGAKQDWGTGTYEVARAAKLGKVALDGDAIAPGKTIAGRAKVTGKPQGLTLVAELWDLAGRLLSRSAVPVRRAGDVRFRLTCPEALTNIGWVKCRLLDGERFVDEGRASLALTQPRPPWTDYEVQMPWHHRGVYPWSDLIEQQYRTGGITSTADPYLNFWMTADLHGPGFGIGWWERHEYIKQRELYGKTKDKRYLVRHPCFHTDAFRKPVCAALRKRLPPMRKYSPRVYYISDEASVTCYGDAFDLCWSEATLVAFRRWLRKECRTLDALNAQWGTRYRSWEKVLPATWEEAQARGNPAPWVDHRVFMNQTFAGAFDYAAGLCRSIDPVGLVTVSGTQSPGSHNGADWWLVDNVIDYLQPYSGGGQDEMHRSFNPKLIITGFTAYERYGVTLEHEIWHRFLHGHAGASIFWGYSMVDPDLKLNAQGRSMEKAFGELRNEGIYRTVRELKRDNDGVALHYSMTSGHVWWVQDGKLKYQDLEYAESTSYSFRRFMRNRVRWSQLLEDSGYQYDYLAYDLVEQGALRKFKALILPGSIALSAQEVTQIKAFVRAGGLVIADVQPGTTDGHGRPRAEGALAGLFASGGYGKGRAVLLDKWLAELPDEARTKREGEALRTRVREALAQSGVLPSATVIGDNGAHPVGIERVTWTGVEVEVVGLLRELRGTQKTRQDGIVEFTPTTAAAKPAAITLRMREKGHLYDLRTHKYLGLKQAIKTTLTGGEPRIYARLPYQVEGVALRATRAAKPADAMLYEVKVKADAKQLAKHVVKVEVFGPDRRKRDLYSGTVETKNGAAAGEFRLALNDPPGEWRIAVTDCYSGLRAEQAVKVR